MPRGTHALAPGSGVSAATAGPGANGEATRLPDGRLMAQGDAPVGGQAVLEGVMMRGVRTWAVAVRAPLPPPPDGDGADAAGPGPVVRVDPDAGPIHLERFELRSWLSRRRVYRLPLVRGVVALVESMAIGLRALGIAANAQMPEDEEPIGGGVWAGTVVVALLLAVGLFFILPVGVTSLFKHQLGSSVAFWAVEGVLRTAIFLGYLVLLSRLRDLRRVFEYHGAEHKVIACYEAGDELVPERAERYSRLHPRCGTSFLLIVMVISIFIFAPIGLPAWYLLMATRVLGVPIIAGLSFEAIKFAGRNRRRPWVRVLMWPGLQLQRLTTREPNRAQLAVAAAALEAVLEVETPGQLSAEELVGVEVVA